LAKLEGKRFRGFVLGLDNLGRRKVWRLRLNEESHRLHGTKLEVDSIRGGLTLFKGANVTFLVGRFPKPGKPPTLRAIDVKIDFKNQTQEPS